MVHLFGQCMQTTLYVRYFWPWNNKYTEVTPFATRNAAEHPKNL